jgi:hypothetical protein
MINEYDRVKAVKDLNDIILKGCNGTVVMVYDKPSPAFIVEFFNDSQETIGVLMVKPDEITTQGVASD